MCQDYMIKLQDIWYCDAQNPWTLHNICADTPDPQSHGTRSDMPGNRNEGCLIQLYFYRITDLAEYRVDIDAALCRIRCLLCLQYLDDRLAELGIIEEY